MKIVIATSRSFHLTHLARELSLLGHEVTLISYVPKWRMRSYGLGKVRYIDLFWAMAPLSALALQRSFSALCRSQTERIMPLFDCRVAEILPECDVFIGLSGVICQGFTAARTRYGALTLCERGSAHVDEQAQLISGGQQQLSRQYFRRERQSYALANITVVPSRFAEATFLARGHHPSRLFRNLYGVDRQRFPLAVPQPAISSRSLRALFVGAWSYQKGCDFILQALHRMPWLQVTHVGKQADIAFPDTPRFRSLGHLDNARLSEIYKTHDVLMLPSRQDGFGMVLLEAFASGLPVVASRNTGAADIKELINLKERVQLMDGLNADGLVRALKAVQAQATTTPLAERDLQALSWQAYAQRYEAFLQKALSAPHRFRRAI